MLISTIGLLLIIVTYYARVFLAFIYIICLLVIYSIAHELS